MGELRNRSIRVDDDVWAAIQALPGRTQNDALRAVLIDDGPSLVDKIDKILELARSLPDDISAAILESDALTARQVLTTPDHAFAPLAVGDVIVTETLGPNTVRKSVNGEMVVPAPRPEGHIRCRCIHTGCRGSYFQGTSRFQTLCDGCREIGHLGDPRNCGACAEDQGAI